MENQVCSKPKLIALQQLTNKSQRLQLNQTTLQQLTNFELDVQIPNRVHEVPK